MHIEPCSIKFNFPISKFIGYVLSHLGVPSVFDLKDFQLVSNFNWYHLAQVSFKLVHARKLFPRRYARSKTHSIDIFFKFFVIIELPPCMIWFKAFSFKCLVVYLIFTLSFHAHTYGKLSSYHASFVILWSTLVITQLISSLISYKLDHDSWN